MHFIFSFITIISYKICFARSDFHILQIFYIFFSDLFISFLFPYYPYAKAVISIPFPYRNQNTFIRIVLSTRILFLYRDQTLLYQWPIAIGKAQTPTPIGNWQIVNKKILTDNSSFGSRWLGLNNPSYGIHGTNNSKSIGNAVSMGCIRMHNSHIETLFPLVKIGTSVIISNSIDESFYT